MTKFIAMVVGLALIATPALAGGAKPWEMNGPLAADQFGAPVEQKATKITAPVVYLSTFSSTKSKSVAQADSPNKWDTQTWNWTNGAADGTSIVE